MSSSHAQNLIRSRNLNINNCNSLKRLTAIAYTLCQATFIMEKVIRHRLNDKSISDLKAILEICKEKGKTDMKWKERSEWVEEILVGKVDYIFD